MSGIRKCIYLCFILLYGYNQSIFSHLLIIEHHHVTKIATHDHLHDSGENHQHIEKSTQACVDSNCESMCQDIESSKQTVCNNNLYKVNLEDFGSFAFSIEKNGYILQCDHTLAFHPVATSPPIPIQELMPRVGPVVRII